VPVRVLDEAIEVLAELPGQSGLADTGGAGHGHEPDAPIAARGMEQILEQSELVVPADEWRLEGARAVSPAQPGDDPHRAPGRHRRRLALELLITGRLERDGTRGRAHGGFADEDRTLRRAGLEAGGGVDQVTRDHALPDGTDGHSGLAREDARACRRRGAQ
jgi:hypothetical protein